MVTVAMGAGRVEMLMLDDDMYGMCFLDLPTFADCVPTREVVQCAGEANSNDFLKSLDECGQ